eukprot:TRINITY_DN1164_c0_g1_i1.p1 TRINITY_DN1164_c0_g1~~TRINITY_DN1164_c0_g1_i1.p1  ORF type:complete len:301 (-),score=112.34 TRINITY_DN1164_c0_g1_i1:135-1037(-)
MMLSRQVQRTSHVLAVIPASSYEGARNMATLKELRLRIASVKAITKLTKTMQMIANNKMRSAQRKAEAVAHFTEAGEKVLKEVPATEDGQNLLVAITADKGMCGSINSQIIKYAKGMLKENPNYQVVVGGSKGASPMAKEFPSNFVFSLKDLGKKEFSYMETGFAVEQMLATASNAENVTVLFNQFKNAVTYIPTEIPIPGPKVLNENLNKFAKYEFEEAESTTMRDLFEFQVWNSVWGSIFQNRSSELAARMSSMDNATKNATGITGALNIAYNRGRQGAITTELVEICSGAAAIEQAS